MERVAEILDAKPKDLFTVEPDHSVAEAIDSMREHHIHSLLVVADGQLLGIITDRDLRRKVEGPGLDPSTLRVDQIMTRSLVTVDRQGTIQDCIRLMADNTIHHLPVCENGALVGMVSWSDLMELALKD